MEQLIGQIQLLPYRFTMKHWAPCEGQMLNIPQHQALFALIGTEFGGDGTATFALPDLRDKAPLAGVRYFIALAGIWPTMG